MNYCDFSKVCEKKKIKKKNMKNIIRTLKVCIAVMAKLIHLKFGMECFHPRRTFRSKNNEVLLRHYLVKDVSKRQFLGSGKIHTCPILAVLGYTTHYRLS